MMTSSHPSLGKKDRQLKSRQDVRSQSYDFWIYSYDASVVVGKSVVILEKNNLYSKNMLSY
jgi:hypothetical protein